MKYGSAANSIQGVINSVEKGTRRIKSTLNGAKAREVK
jgi:hypothetical protein